MTRASIAQPCIAHLVPGYNTSLPSIGQLELRADQVGLGDHFGHRMLDLDARIDLDEEVITLVVHQEFDRSRGCGNSTPVPASAHRRTIRLRRLHQKPGAGASSINFCRAALDGTLSFAQAEKCCRAHRR